MRPKRGITEFVYTAYPGFSPAKANRRTGVVYINENVWEFLPTNHKLFVLLHEEAHIILDSNDEDEADALAFKRYADLGHSLNDSVLALSKVLTMSQPQHYWRVYRQLQRAKEYDYYNNGNKRFRL